MEQKDLMHDGDLWQHARELAERHDRLLEHFQLFAEGGVSLASEGALSGHIKAAPGTEPVSYFDVTYAGRTFPFRFTSRVAQAGRTGHIAMTAIDPLTKTEVPIPNDSGISFTGEGRLIGLTNPDRDGDPITLNSVAARYLVLLAVYNAVTQPA